MVPRVPHCIFCDIVRGAAEVSVCYEDTEAIAFMDIQPINPGAVVVVPRRVKEHSLPRFEPLADVRLRLAAHDPAVTLSGVVRPGQRSAPPILRGNVVDRAFVLKTR